jgi:hypothetical protein
MELKLHAAAEIEPKRTIGRLTCCVLQSGLTRSRLLTRVRHLGVEADDPYFGGAGPRRTDCGNCRNCMIGCGRGAKNS